MKQTKYILIIIFSIFISFFGIERAFAKSATCYYIGDKLEAWVIFETTSNSEKSYAEKGTATTRKYDKNSVKATASVKNIDKDWNPSDLKGYVVDEELVSVNEINENWKSCPKYLWFNKKNSNAVVSDDYDVVKLPKNESGKGYIAERVSVNKFWDLTNCKDEICKVGEDITLICDGKNSKASLFGDPNYAGNDTDEDPPSTAYLLKQALNILRIAGVAIAITLGIIDIAKAVVASKEDEMKKAQATFIKRIIACVIIFLVPTFINIVMKMSYDMWAEKNYQTCELRDLGITAD